MTPFADFKKKDKKSDKVMMAIYLAYDAKSDFVRSGMEQAQILNDVTTNFIEDKKFKWEDYQEIIDAYIDICTSRVHKKLNFLFLEIEKISDAIKELVWDDPAEADLKTKLFTASKSLFQEFTQLQKDLNEEVSELLFEGDYSPSWLEQQSL